MVKMKRYFFLPLTVLLLFSMTACGAKGTKEIVSEALTLDVSGGSEVSAYDTHSGNGDGTSCIVFCFKDHSVLTTIQEDTRWKAFPLDETVQALVYGVEKGTGSYGPYLTDADGKPLVPEIQHGYYLLLDRQEDSAAEADMLQRSSLNFDLGIYDADTDTLYFCQLDT